MTLNGATGIGVLAEDWQSQPIAAPYFEVRSSEHITRCFGYDDGCELVLGSETRHHLRRAISPLVDQEDCLPVERLWTESLGQQTGRWTCREL
jgi:hypothetical protein